MVVSTGTDEALGERMKVASKLWAEGISAEYLHKWPVGVDAMMSMCHERHIPVMVHMKIPGKADKFKVRG